MSMGEEDTGDRSIDQTIHFQCSYCFKQFESVQELKDHLFYEHGVEWHG